MESTNLLLTTISGVFAVVAVLVASMGCGSVLPRRWHSSHLTLALPVGFLCLHVVFIVGFLLVPLSSGLLRILILTLAVIMLIRQAGRINWRSSQAVAGVMTCAALVLTALTTVTNYDAGLYYHSAIAHLRSDNLVLGLANLHHRLGNWSGSFGLAAFMQSGAWSSESYRLANVVVIVVALVGVLPRVGRLRNGSARPGDVLIAIAVPLCFITVLGSPGFYIAAPTPDTGFALFSVLASAALVDAVAGRGDRAVEEMLIWSTLALFYRPTALVLLGVGVVVLTVGFRSRQRKLNKGLLLPLVGVTAHLAVTFGLTGFPVFPVSQFPEVVSWAVPRSMREYQSRIVTTIAREAGEEISGPGNWNWLGPWASRNWRFLVETGSLLVIGSIVVSCRCRGRDLRMALIAALLMSIPVVFWFLMAPDPRFGFGLVYAWAAAPLALALTRAGYTTMRVRRRRLIVSVAGSAGLLALWFVALTSGGSSDNFLDQQHIGTPKQVVLETDGLTFTRPLGDPGPQCGSSLWCSPEDLSGLIVDRIGPFTALSKN